MLSTTLLTANQDAAINRLYETDRTMLIAGMGSGKTIISLTAINELIEDGELDRVLIFAPLKVVQTVWRQEALKWEHTKRLNVALCTGTPRQRDAIVKHAREGKGILLVNFDLMAWFFQTYKSDHGFDGILIDELSKLKGGGKGFKKLRYQLKSFRWFVGLTGTPVAEDFQGLFYQTFALDNGRRFGMRKDLFLRKFFYPTDYQEYNWELLPDADKRIMWLLRDLVYTVPDYRHELPALNIIKEMVTLPSFTQGMYDEFAKKQVLDIHEWPTQTADNAAVLSGKLQQIASGSMYIDDEFGERLGVHVFHDHKMIACRNLVLDLDKQPVIICYWYKHELARLEKTFPNAVNLNDKGAMESWQKGEIDILLMQPMSASHGIELQLGGHNMIFFSPIWSNDIMEQTIARIWRKGQKNECNIYEIVAVDTVDEMIVDRIEGKKKFDALFHKLI